MKKFTLYPVLLAILALPALSLADSAAPGAYMTGFIGIHVPVDANASSSDFVTGKSYYDKVNFDPGLNIGAAGGYDFGVFRMEGELSYKNAEIKSINDQVTGERFHNAAGDVGVLALMFNGFMNLYNESPVTPYLGGGIGFATVHLSDTHGTRIVDGSPQRVLLYGAGDDTVFAYQIGGGVDIAVKRHFSLDIGYRYFSANHADIDSGQAILTNLGFRSHTTMLGFKFKY